MTNVNLREEFEQPYTKEQQYEKHQKMLSASEDLHMALRSCQEINEAKSLYQFFLDVQKINPKIPAKKDVDRLKRDEVFLKFLKNVIVCSQQNYDKAELEKLAAKDH